MKNNEAQALKDTLLNYFSEYGCSETLVIVIDSVRAYGNISTGLAAVLSSEIDRDEAIMLGNQIHQFAENLENANTLPRYKVQ